MTTGQATEPMTLLTSLPLRLFCPRCDRPQETRVHWWGNTRLAGATLSTAPHDCPGPAGTPEFTGDPNMATAPLW